MMVRVTQVGCQETFNFVRITDNLFTTLSFCSDPTRTNQLLINFNMMRNVLHIALIGAASAFVAPSKATSRLSVAAFGITEWRDLDVLEASVAVEQIGEPTVRNIPLLPVDSSQVLLQGQTLHLQLFEDDEIRLFQKALDHNGGIFGIGLMSTDEDDGYSVLLDTVPLVEIQDYNMMGGDFGIFCKGRVVGRAAVHEAVQPEDCEKDNLSAICSERFDRFGTANLELANSVASMCENLIADISGIEESSSQLNSDLADDTTRIQRFNEAYQAALEADNQGYLLPSPSAEEGRSWRELNAISWAAFSTSSSTTNDATYRLSALDMDNITNRLKLAMYWLSDLRAEIEQTEN
jgi:hypothetical protein